jgi:predicted  nucleic acid-binding Zn-ribbon protein
MTIADQRKVSDTVQTTINDKRKAGEQRDAANAEIKNLEEELKKVSGQISCAQDELERIRSEEKPAEPTHYEDRRQAQELIPEIAITKIGMYR